LTGETLSLSISCFSVLFYSSKGFCYSSSRACFCNCYYRLL